MRRFLIFFGSGLLFITLVFIYAQTQRDKATIVTKTDFTAETQGKVLSAQTSPNNTTPASQLPIKINIERNPAYIWWPQSITVKTKPGAEVRLMVTYPNGSINNNGSQTGIANDKGEFVVRWNINGNYNEILGKATVAATAVKGKKSGSATSKFTITRYQSR